MPLFQHFCKPIRNSMKKLREKKLYLRFFCSMLTAFLICMVTFTVLYQGYFSPRYKEKLIRAHENHFSAIQASINTDLRQYQKFAVQIASDPIFSAHYLARYQSFEVVETLRQFRGCNAALLDIVYVNRETPILYTSLGTYNPAFYNTDSVVTKGLAADTLWKDSFLSPVISMTNLSGKQVLEYVVPVLYGDAVVVFQMDADALLQGLLGEEDGFLLMAGETPLYSRRPREDDAVQYQEFTLEAAVPDTQFVFRTPYNQLVHETMMMNLLFTLCSLALTVICLLLVRLLARRQYRPISRLNNLLTETLEQPPDTGDELERIQQAIGILMTQQQELLRQKREAERERVLRRLITGHDLDPAVIDRQCREAGIDVIRRSCCVLMLAARDRKSMPPSLCGDFSERLTQAGLRFYDLEYPEQCAHLFLVILPPDGEQALCRTLVQISSGLAAEPAFFVSVGSACYGCQDIARSFQEARVTAQLREDHKEEAVLQYLQLQPMMSRDYRYPSAEIDALYHSILSRSKNQIRQSTQAVLESVRNQFCSSLFSRCICYDIANTMIRATAELECLSGEPLSVPILPDLLEFRTFSDFERFVRTLEYAILDHTYPNRKNELYADVVCYIKENLQSPQLCMKMLCSHFSVSSSTLTALFRENMGMTVTGYITALRNEYVKMLLVSTDISVSSITQLLGYSQSSSFIRQFKNTEGITPGEYRQKYRLTPPKSTCGEAPEAWSRLSEQ